MAKDWYDTTPAGLMTFTGQIRVAALRGPDGGAAGRAQFTARCANEVSRAAKILTDALSEVEAGRGSYDSLRTAVRDALGLEG